MGKLAGKYSANVANHELNYHLASYYFLAEYIYLPCQNKFANPTKLLLYVMYTNKRSI